MQKNEIQDSNYIKGKNQNAAPKKWTKLSVIRLLY